MADRFKTRELALSGRLRTADDPATIGPNDLSVCKNMRPADQYPRGIGGMTKINTAALTSTGIRNGFHFRKSQPAESHLLAWTTDGKVWKNDAVVPAQGAFSALFTDTAGGSTGRFATAPGGALAYANGVEACLWGGTEYRCAGFIDYPTTGQVYDYSDLITNTKTDAQNVATIHPLTSGAVDAATLLLLHCDGSDSGTTFTDSSPTTAHTVTANGNAQTKTATKKFGSASGYFDGTGDYLSIPDDADFDLSAGVFTLEAWVNITSGAYNQIYYQQTDANNYFKFYIIRDAVGGVGYVYRPALQIYAASAEVVWLSNGSFSAGSWHHVAVVENGDAWYLFLDGTLVSTATDTSRAANYTGSVQIGYDGATYFTGYMDEIRLSNSARWTSGFSVPSAPYGPSYTSTTYIGSIMPLDGLKFTVGTVNAETATMAMSEWDGASWSALTITDNTAVAGKTLAATGTVTWATTAATSKPTQVEKVYLYWYKMVILGTTDFSGITLSQVTVSIPFQAIKDIWDGEERPCNAFIGYKSSKYLDMTTNVLENGYSSTGSTADAATFANLSGYTVGDYLYCGFIERMAGVTMYVIDGNGNTNAALLSWDYWNGSAWTPLTATDGTLDGTKTLARSGWITWPPASRASEFRRSDLGMGIVKSGVTTTQWNNDTGTSELIQVSPEVSSLKSTGSLYYYRASFSAALASSPAVSVYHVAGIPAPTDIRGYSFPVLHQGRTILLDNVDGNRNSVRMSASGTTNVFNGLDSYEFSFGQKEPINAAASLFLRFSSSVQDMLVIGKQGEIHLLEGNGSDSDPYRTRMVSEKIGVKAPLTMVTVPVGDLGGGVRRSLVLWESQRGIEVFDGASLMDPLLSHDIRDKFDPAHANYAGSASNTAFYDPVFDEYHWCPVGTAEWVFSFKYKKWYQPVRGTGKYLYGGIPVMDTGGNSYVYGFDNAGYVYRLENGKDFDGNDIVHTLKTGAIALNENRISEEATLRMVKVVQVAKNTTANSMTVTHFGDTDTTGNSIGTITPSASGKRLRTRILNAGSKGPFVHHEFQLALTTNDETCGCEPIYIVAYYDGERQDVR